MPQSRECPGQIVAKMLVVRMSEKKHSRSTRLETVCMKMFMTQVAPALPVNSFGMPRFCAYLS